jgi:hypothetical protein
MARLLVFVPGLLLAAAPLAASESTVEQRRAYDTAAAAAGRDAGAHVKLALWCEAHGLTAERQKHLALAVLADPANTIARGLMGLVRDGSAWRRPADIAAKVDTAGGLGATLAEYNARREKTAASADAQWKLALWCADHGLAAEAKAHLATVVRLEPGRAAAWKRLGYTKHGTRWMTPEQIEAQRADREAQEKADKYWLPVLRQTRDDLRDGRTRSAALATLAKVDDPRAFPSIVRVFMRAEAADQTLATQLLGQIDCAASSRGLALLAASGASPEIRRAACEILRRRDPREYVGLLIDRLDDPTPFEIGVIAQGDSLFRVLMTEQPDCYVMNVYDGPIAGPVMTGASRPATFETTEPSTWVPGVLTTGFGADPLSQNTVRFYNGLALQIEARERAREARVAQQTEEIAARDAQSLAQRNAAIVARNAGIFQALANTTGVKQPDDREAWKSWYMDMLGYRYEKAQRGMKPVVLAQRFTGQTGGGTYECFAAGTPVQTLAGPKAIETLRVGDRVLAQDTQSGALGYQPILTVYKNPPAATVRIDMGGETIVPSTLHRFWKAGQGWVLARELKQGDVLRTVRGPITISSVNVDKTQPVYNLDVDVTRTYFVGDTGALVHDNSMPELRTKGFDARPELSANP